MCDRFAGCKEDFVESLERKGCVNIKKKKECGSLGCSLADGFQDVTENDVIQEPCLWVSLL